MRAQILKPHHHLLHLILLATISGSHSASSKLRTGSSISVEDNNTFLTSPDNSFTCGFYTIPGTNAYWFAIWFTNSKDKTVIWTPNRSKPVSSSGSRVSIWRDGTMALTDFDGSVNWLTNATGRNVVTAELLDTGNLVLKNPRGEILWQSFDFPTDTLLPTQTLTKNKKLVSSLREGSFGEGYFKLYFDANNVLILLFESIETSSIYWPNPYYDIYENNRTSYNASRVAVLDDNGVFLSSDKFQAYTSDKGDWTKRRLTLDRDGNLRIYSLVNSTGRWKTTWQAISQPCQVHGVCGENALCVYAQNPKCICTPGFEVKDPSDWKAGCKPAFNDSLSLQVKFIELFQTEYFGNDLVSHKLTTLEACREQCLMDSNCKAFTYRTWGNGRCYIKGSLSNGFVSPEFPGSTYIKLPKSVQVSSKPLILYGSDVKCQYLEAKQLVGSKWMYDFPKRMARWAYIYSFCFALGAIELIFIVLGWWFLLTKHGVPASVEVGYHMLSSQFRRFSYKELKKATDNFRDELGRGGSGAVYKGILADDRVVAVKRLGDVFQAQEEFLAETRTIGEINHMNLVRMWGFCSKGKHRLLVYEYIENMSLDKHLFNSKFLSWKQRYAVALGTAKGLAYLHHECLEWVIHCDIKPENILLDGEFQPKIADFGLAKLFRRDSPSSEITRIRGTKGYMAPEWALNEPITAKVDVYGYGVVVLEMIKGMKLSNWAMEGSNVQENPLKTLRRRVKERLRHRSSSWIESIVDPRLKGRFSRNQARTLIQIGISCVDEDRSKRPTMASVVQTLMECEDEIEIRNLDD